MSIFLVDTDLVGFKHGRLLKKLGRPAADTAELFFEDIRLPSSAILSGINGLNKGFQLGEKFVYFSVFYFLPTRRELKIMLQGFYIIYFF